MATLPGKGFVERGLVCINLGKRELKNVILWGHKGDWGHLLPPPPPGLYVKKGPDTDPLIIYPTQCLTPVLVQLPILYKKKPQNDCIQQINIYNPYVD